VRKADDHDLRDALSEEVENLEPSDELWNNIYKRSVAKQAKRRNPWLKSALAMGAAAAAVAVFLLSGQWNPGTGPSHEPPPGPGPVTLVQPLVAPGETPPSLAADRLYVRYNHTQYWYNGESVPTQELGGLLTRTTKESGDQTTPQPDGSSNLPEAGKEVRAIKGVDPVRRIAVQTDQGWYVLDNILNPLSPPSPNP
jgi:hypothetical protein